MRGVTTLLLAALVAPLGGQAHRKTEAGNRQYAAGQLDEALRSYTEAQVVAPEAPELYYDIGNVLFRQEDYEGAAEAYTRALLSAPPSGGLAAAAAYNLGNARYRTEQYQAAAEAYERALRARPDDRDAKQNLELSLRALEQQQQQQQSGGEDPDQKDKEKEKEEQQQQQQQGEKEGPEQQQQQGGEDEEQPRPGSEGAKQGEETGRMTPEQAARLLDGLGDEERKALRQQVRRDKQGEAPEKDW